MIAYDDANPGVFFTSCMVTGVGLAYLVLCMGFAFGFVSKMVFSHK